MNLKLNILEKKFDDKVIFKDFSYKFDEKGVYLLFGKSGTGKTTLLRIIAGLDKKFKGTVEGAGAENVSFVFQEYRLFPNLTALNNVVLAISDGKDDKIKKKAMNLLLNLGFSESDLHLLPGELSGGMKQRVSFARALLKNAPILLLDEPTKELDSELRNKLYEIIKEEAKTRLVIMVSHNKEDIDFLSPIIINF